MEHLVFRVLAACIGLYILDLVFYGFALGFPVFFALCAFSGLIFWGYHRWVPMRAHKSQWQLQPFGEAYYWMEVA